MIASPTPPSSASGAADSGPPAGASEGSAAGPENQAQEIVDNMTSLPDLQSIDVEQILADLLPAAIAVGLRVIGVMLLLVAAYFFSRWLRGVVRSAMERAELEPTIRKFTTNLTGWLVFGIALIVSLGIFGVNTTTFAAVLGAAGLAIGLGFQGALANLAAGVLLLILRPFRVGDLVEVNDELGIVEAIDLYFTKINRFDDTHTILPNDEVLGNKIENYSRNGTRRVEVPVETDYAIDPVRAREALESVIPRLDTIDTDAENGVVLLGLGASGVQWEVRVHCKWDKYLATKQAVVREVWRALDEARIEIPFPHRSLIVSEPVNVRLGSSSDGSVRVNGEASDVPEDRATATSS